MTTIKLDRLTKASFFARFASLVIVVVFGKSWDDCEGVEIRGSTKTLDSAKLWVCLRDMMRNAVGEYRSHMRRLADLPAHPNYVKPTFLEDLYSPLDSLFTGSKTLTVETIINLVRDTYENCECSVSVMTKEDYDRKAEEKERAEMEGFASSFCREHGLSGFGTLDFIRKLIEVKEGQVTRIESYREGMREDGLCIGYGVSREQWSDEYNAAAGDRDGVEEMAERVLNWLQAKCPLTWALWEEEKRADKRSEN